MAEALSSIGEGRDDGLRQPEGESPLGVTDDLDIYQDQS